MGGWVSEWVCLAWCVGEWVSGWVYGWVYLFAWLVVPHSSSPAVTLTLTFTAARACAHACAYVCPCVPMRVRPALCVPRAPILCCGLVQFAGMGLAQQPYKTVVFEPYSKYPECYKVRVCACLCACCANVRKYV